MARICIRRGGALGDVLMLTPVIRELKRRRPEAQIFVATQYPQVFDGSPWVTACIPAKTLDPVYFDEFIDLDGEYERNPRMHVIDAYARRVLGEEIIERRLELFRQERHSETARYLLRAIHDEPYIAIHIRHHHWPNRNFAPEFWLAVVSGLLKDWNGYVVQIGDVNDGFLKGHPRLLNLVGSSALPETTEIIAKARCFIGVDTATLHMAACTTTPIVNLFTCVSHEYRQPFRGDIPFVPIKPAIECYGCQANYPPPVTDYQCARGDAACVQRIDPADVVTAVLSLSRA